MLAHDWGSAGMWEYLARAEAQRSRRVVHVSCPVPAPITRTGSSWAASSGPTVHGGSPRRSASWVALTLHGRVLRTRVGADDRPQPSSPTAVTLMLKNRDGIPADQRTTRRPTRPTPPSSSKVYRANYFRIITCLPGATTTSTCRCSSSSTRTIRSSGRTSTTTPTNGCRGCGAATSSGPLGADVARPR